jgi:hypothetical protein
MQADFFALFCQGISVQRMEAYRHRGEKRYSQVQDLEVCADYLWNIVLCESLYPALHMLEIVLRNTLHNTISSIFGTQWFDHLIVGEAYKRIDKAKARLQEHQKKPDPGRIVAELSLGFWVSLFDSRYEKPKSLWPMLFRNQRFFAYLPTRQRKRQNLSPVLNKILELRNRVFHHEPIYYWRDIAAHHQKILEIINCINPSALEVLKTIDRFPKTYQLGAVKYTESLASLIAVPTHAS